MKNMEKKRYKVLVAEDDPFQRLSIIDILKVTYYDVTPVENGDQAIEVLKEEGSNFDIVLLDLLMPKMSGKDVLEFIMKDKRLRKIPVIVMSARNDKSIVSSCLKAGAKSFIIKPLRVQECRSFVKYIETSNETDTEQSLSKYTSIKVLGAGASGTVELVKHKETDKLFALKTIPLTNLNERERSSAELEVHFLKVLNGPTLIKSYQSYIEEENIYIIMEYAEGGSLDDKIKFAKLKKQPFETDTILNWISQVILGVMLMHSKNILHRDLKCQNIFVTKDGVLKIGDFGISKELESMTKMAETNIGTPYFMAPEACKGECYGEKADVWAIGVILYELTMLKKPFDADTVKGVFDKIINTPIDFSETHIDVEIKMLIIAMLDKDQLNRPSIWELSNFTCINERINKFVQEQKCEDSVSSVFEWRSIQEEEKEKDGKDTFSIFDENKLDVLAHLIRSVVKVEDTKVGWFGKTQKCVNGNEILKWIKNHLEHEDQKAKAICQKMLNEGIIYRIDGKDSFQGNCTTLYHFYEDRDDIPSNMIIPWKNEIGNPITISTELVKLIEEIFLEAFIEEEDQHIFIADHAISSSKFESFLSKISQLEKVVLNFKNYDEGLCFFLNVYQCMYIHSLLKYMTNPKMHENNSNKFYNFLSYVWSNNTDNFYYNIGGYDYTLDELKHGLLRGNKKKPGSFFRTLGKRDERALVLDGLSDPKILFLCFDLPEIPIHIECFDDPDTLDEKFDTFLAEYFKTKVEIDTLNGEITIPYQFERYQEDFGGSVDSCLKYIWEWFKNCEFDLDEITKLVNKKALSIKYSEYFL